jgi:nucleotide-binding universal stress UspA family protein
LLTTESTITKSQISGWKSVRERTLLDYYKEGDTMERILVPVDGSEQSHKAIAFAADLAKHYNAALYLLHVYKITIIPEGLGDYVMTEREELQALGDKIIAAAEKEAKGHGIELIQATVVEGDPAERIIDYAKEHDVDIIVIGSRGLGTFKGLLLGSVSDKVTHRADRTCVIVR